MSASSQFVKRFGPQVSAVSCIVPVQRPHRRCSGHSDAQGMTMIAAVTFKVLSRAGAELPVFINGLNPLLSLASLVVG